MNTVDDHTVFFVQPTLYQRTAGVLIGIVLLIITIRMIQKFRLREEHALPWLAGSILLIVVCIFVPVLRLLTALIGAGSPASTLFAACLLFLILQSLYLTSAVSRQKKQIQELTIELALERDRNTAPPLEDGDGAP